jgi:ParB family chromosome partitioning protein
VSPDTPTAPLLSPTPFRPNPARLLPPLIDRERTLEQIRQMADSMRDIGLLQPIRVKAEGGAYRVVAGETRRRAALFLGWAEIAAILVALDLTETAELIETFEENNTRTGWSILQRAEVYQRLIRLNDWSLKEVAAHTHTSPSDVTKALLVSSRFPEEFRPLVLSGEFPASCAYLIARLDDPAKRLEFGRRVASGEWKRDKLEAELAAVTLKRKPKAKPVSVEASGCKLTVTNLDAAHTFLKRVQGALRQLTEKGGDLSDLPVYLRMIQP